MIKSEYLQKVLHVFIGFFVTFGLFFGSFRALNPSQLKSDFSKTIGGSVLGVSDLPKLKVARSGNPRDALTTNFKSQITIDTTGAYFVTGFIPQNGDMNDLAGTDLNTYPSNAAVLTKYNADHTYAWSKQIITEGVGTTVNLSASGIKDVAVDSSNNIYLVGRFNGNAGFGLTEGKFSNGNYDIFLTKVNSNGVYQWTKTWGSAYDDFASNVEVSSDGFVYVTGTFFEDRTTTRTPVNVDFNPDAGVDNKMSVANSDVFVSKFNISGAYVWTRTFGSNFYDYGSSLAIKSNGTEFALLGKYGEQSVTGSTFDMDPSGAVVNKTGRGCFLSKFDSGGNFMFGRVITQQTNISSNNMQCGSIANYGDQNLYLTGTATQSTSADFNDSSGDDVKTASGSGVYQAFVTGYTFSGNYLFTTMITTNTNLIMCGTSVGDHGGCPSVDTYSNGNFIVGFGTYYNIVPDTGGLTNGMIISFNSSGTKVWEFEIDRTDRTDSFDNAYLEIFDITINKSDNSFFVTGSINKDLGQNDYFDFDPSNSTSLLNSANNGSSGFIAKYIDPTPKACYECTTQTNDENTCSQATTVESDTACPAGTSSDSNGCKTVFGGYCPGAYQPPVATGLERWILGTNGRTSIDGGIAGATVPGTTVNIFGYSGPSVLSEGSITSGTGNLASDLNRISRLNQYSYNYINDALDLPFGSPFTNWYDQLYDRVTRNGEIPAVEAKTTISGNIMSSTLSQSSFLGFDTKESWLVNGNLTIESGSTCNVQGLIFISGNLTIKPDFKNLNSNTGCIFIVKGSVIIPAGTTATLANNYFNIIEAYIITDGEFITQRKP